MWVCSNVFVYLEAQADGYQCVGELEREKEKKRERAVGAIEVYAGRGGGD